MQNKKLELAGIGEGFIATQINDTGKLCFGELEKSLTNKTFDVLIEGIYPNGMKAVFGFGL